MSEWAADLSLEVQQRRASSPTQESLRIGDFTAVSTLLSAVLAVARAGFLPLPHAIRNLSSMRAPLVAAVTALSLACSALAVPLAERQIQTYLPPSQDPFYRPPASFASAQNGAILASRKVSTYFDLLADATYQVLYKTTAATGEADATVATLFRPKNALSPPRIMLLLCAFGCARRSSQVH